MFHNPIKVLIIDDSAKACRTFYEWLKEDPEIDVVGTASDPYTGRDKIVYLQPDVLILDIAMPKMDGLQFLEILMKYHPMPVIVVGSRAREDCEASRRALELGAADVITGSWASCSIPDGGPQLAERVKAASRIKKPRQFIPAACHPLYQAPNVKLSKTARKIIAIGASTGGTEAIKHVLAELPVEIPPIVVVQHMPEHFTKSFAERLDKICKIDVKEAEDHELLSPGKALIAPGNQHMVLRRGPTGYYVEIKNGPLVYHQRPSVEILFDSVARCAGPDAMGIILTGMGRDGASGLLEKRKAGAFTIAQDEKSSTVYGMPKEAAAIGAAVQVIPLNKMAQAIQKALTW